MPQQQEFRTVPYSRSAEESVLGAVLFDPEKISVVVSALREDDFYLQSTREVFCAMNDLFQLGRPIDPIVLQEQLISRGSFDAIGGISYLSELAGGVPTTENLHYYLNIVQEKSVRRKLLSATGEIEKLCLAEQEEASELLSTAEQKIYDLLQTRDSKDFVAVGEMLDPAIRMMEERCQNKGKLGGIGTGISDLDKALSGLKKSELIILGARPAVGKSALALNIAQYAASREKIPTAFYALEMSNEQLVARLLSAEALVDAERIKLGNLDRNDWTKLLNAAEVYKDAPLYLNESGTISISEIRSQCQQLKREKNLGLIVIDYLQLMSGPKTESRQTEVSAISRQLKLMAKELDVPVLALSQLSRKSEDHSDHRPKLSDLRESGSIEQDADVVMFLYRNTQGDENPEEKNLAECHIAKLRNGSPGKIDLCFLGQFTKFTNREKHEDV